MANIAENTYLFYGNPEELLEAHKCLTELFSEKGYDESCVDDTAGNKGEWIVDLEDFNPECDTYFKLWTESKWYGNPTYWHDWTVKNYPNVAVAFECYEPGMRIFQRVDPDGKFNADDVYLTGTFKFDDVPSFPEIIASAIYPGTTWICDVFEKSQLDAAHVDVNKLQGDWDMLEPTYTSYKELR